MYLVSNGFVEKEKRNLQQNFKTAEIVETNTEKKKEPSIWKILEFNKPEWYYILIGCIASIISGAVNPAFAIVFSQVIAVNTFFLITFLYTLRILYTPINIMNV